MKRAKALITLSLVLTVILIIFTIGDYLALHDIWKDYVSRGALTYLKIETSKPLPYWTKTNLEWTSVTVSYFVRFLVIIANVVVLYLLIKELPVWKKG